ncbi:DUF3486 family protein [Ignatzschineria rhizosphaerae]|uniref:DUF3486 family protein n=1 Tax=Ignatzschineria rhizosphaerae TaxID=2923279 RepID=A0ABY3WYH6_9GAMM|nr:DUF3486 family protein [Ignatzschineria rhizosphaerae]UNM95679.1 DUF3486 family protein [Ignatzschineria rhizosphaerae]
MSRVTRGRASKVDLLPEALKEELHKLLRNKSNTQLDVLDAINELIEEHGLDDEAKLSRSGLNRYAAQMETIGKQIKEAREISKQWAETLGTNAESDVSMISIEMLRSVVFNITMKLAQDDEIKSDDLRNLTMSIARLERAAATSQKRIIEARKEFAEELAENIEASVREKGMSKQDADFIRAIIQKSV